MTPRKLLFCNTSPRKSLLLCLTPFHFETNFQSKLNVFHHFSKMMPKTRIWDTLWDPARAKMAPKIGQVASKCAQKSKDGETVGAPLFLQNHSNYRAVGTRWLLKDHFVDGDWLIFCLFCVSFCSVLYNIVIAFIWVFCVCVLFFPYCC